MNYTGTPSARNGCADKQCRDQCASAAAVDKDRLMTASYSGKYGSRESNVSSQVLDGQNIVFKGARYLPYEGLTIVVGWPKGVVEKPAAGPGAGRKTFFGCFCRWQLLLRLSLSFDRFYRHVRPLEKTRQGPETQ